MKLMVLAYMALSLLDGGFTIYEIRVLGAEEANPVMNFFLQRFGMIGFVSAKTFLTLLSGLLLWRLTHLASVRYLTVATVIAYVLLTVYHVLQVISCPVVTMS